MNSSPQRHEGHKGLQSFSHGFPVALCGTSDQRSQRQDRTSGNRLFKGQSTHVTAEVRRRMIEDFAPSESASLPRRLPFGVRPFPLFSAALCALRVLCVKANRRPYRSAHTTGLGIPGCHEKIQRTQKLESTSLPFPFCDSLCFLWRIPAFRSDRS